SEAKLVVFAAGPPADGSDRWDADRWVTRLAADDLAFDTTFNGGEPFALDVSGLELSDGGRRGAVHADGTIVSSGYTNIPGKGNHIVLIRLLPSGAVDTSFGFSDDQDVDFTPGQTHYNPFRAGGGFAEAYGVTILSDGSYVTTGYGTSNMFVPSVSVDIVTTRVRPNGQALLPSFGGKPGPVVTFAGAYAVQSEADTAALYVTAEDRGRAVQALADDRTIHAGFYDGQAALVVLTPNGKPDTEVLGTGRLIYRWTTNFFSVNTDAEASRVVATSAAVAKVVNTSYARTLIATVDVVPAD
ncbi:MAG TPA: delta-60 repeat domain-containing protein, partial [Polyangiaceae bacterium]|nr:delta-60 repeat domain-containing protein [Polyangiaceae bacterium]